jgi:hypothetical protein
MASIQDILKAYRLSYSGSGKVERVERIDATNGGHISDAGKAVLPWHTYVDKTLPDDVLKQVADVRAALKALDPKLPGQSPSASFITNYCTGRSLYFVERGNPAGMAALLADVDVEVQRAKDALDAAETDADKAACRKQVMATLAFRHLVNGREGPPNAVNSYDSEVVTWGMGWSVCATLGRVLSRIYALEKSEPDPDKHPVQKLLYLAGFLYDGGTYYVVDADPAAKTVHAAEALTAMRVRSADNPTLRLFHDTEELHIAWALLGRDDVARRTMTRAQLDAFKAGGGNVAQADKIQTAALYTFIAHLQHWTSARLDVVDWATGPLARPARVSEPFPSEKGDAALAIQTVHCFYGYGHRSPSDASFGQVQTYWAQMTGPDATEEGLTAFKPDYPVMTAGPVASVPDDHLAAHVGAKVYDLGPKGDFQRADPPNVRVSVDPPRGQMDPRVPAPGPSTPELDPLNPPDPPDVNEDDAQDGPTVMPMARVREERSSWGWLGAPWR